MFKVRTQVDRLDVADHVESADSLLSRFVGLIGRDRLEEGRGLFLRDCSSVHTFFMSFPIDVVYLNRDMVVVAVETNLKPWRMGGIHWGAKHVLELRSYAAVPLQPGQKLEFIEEGE